MNLISDTEECGEPPTLSEPLAEAHVFHVGAPLELSCRVERAHELTYALWYHNSGSLLGLTCGLTGTARVDRVRVSSEQLALRPPADPTAPAAPDGCSAQELEAVQRFQLRSALPTDAAVYKCVLWNRFGCVATRTCAILERVTLPTSDSLR